MGRINVLEKHIAELIAAGEVVERPSSVVKELVENCIDAQATSITVEIKDGGTTFIRVTDNGIGIYRDDVPKAFLRNATSKIKVKDDLDSIGTLGFRGEALASICAVARVELITCVKGEPIGTRYEVHGGEEIFFDDFGCADGTTIIVRDIFYNVPARMKFLKKNVSEANSIAGVLDRIAMSHPNISLTFIRDSKKTLSTPGNGDLYSCIYSVYGKQFVETLISLDYELNGITVTGFVSKPLSAKSTRSMQHFFINKRYVKTRTVMVALEEAFKNSLMVGKFPASVMFIDVPLETVDVNVHPSKIEVRFVNERPIFEAVYHSVKNALLKGDIKSSITFGTLNKNTKDKKMDEQILEIKNNFNLKDSNLCSIETHQKKVELILDDDMPEVFIPPKINIDINKRNNFNNADFKKESVNLHNLKVEQKKFEKEIKCETKVDPIYKEIKCEIQDQTIIESKTENINVIGEVFKTYIIIEENDGQLLIIDKHAAHERILFEKLKSKNHDTYSQVLITPQTVTLNKEDYDEILSNTKTLMDAGFEVENFGPSTIKVNTIPLYIDIKDIEPSILEIALYLRQNKKNITTQKLDWIYHSVACRAAIKAGTSLKHQEIVELVKSLRENEEIKYCPHGRPVSIYLKKKDLEKQFGRIM